MIFTAPDEWQVFLEGIQKVFPDREIVDIDNSDPIFHTIYDLDDRFQVPGAQYLCSGRTYEKDENGRPEHWRAHLRRQGPHHGGDLPQHGSGRRLGMVRRSALRRRFAGLAYRIGVNYWIYDLTH